MASKKPLSCFACGNPFLDTSAQGWKIRHGHHVIPRAAGGSNGPVVDICNEDHDLTHRLAEKALGGKLTDTSLKEFIREYSNGVEHASKLYWLVSRVVLAFTATKNDPNKKVLVSVSLSAKLAEKLDTLAVVTGRKSRHATLEFLIESAYRSSVPTVARHKA